MPSTLHSYLPVCFPYLTFCFRIHIEHRPAIEATQVRGLNTETGKLSVVRISPEGVGEGDKPWQRVYNPSFDVTPAELISESRYRAFGLRWNANTVPFRRCCDREGRC